MSASLSEPQKKWLEALVPKATGGAAPILEQSAAAKAKAALRAQVLTEVGAEVDKLKPELVKAFKDYKIEKNGKIIPLRAESHNPDDEISVKGDARGDAKIVGDARAVIASLHKTREQLLVQQAVLRGAGMDGGGQLTHDGSGEKLFSDADIQAELWTPLVRAGIMPEDQVIDRFSEMAQTFQGAQAGYAERLQMFSETAETEAEGGLLANAAGNAATVLEKLGQFTTLAGTVLPELSDKVADRKWLEGLKESTGLAVAAMQTSAAVLKGSEALLTRKDGMDIAEHFIKAVGPAAKLLPVSKEFQDVVPKACAALLGSGKFFDKLIKGDFAGAGNAAGDAIGDALEAVAKADGNDALEAWAGRSKGLVKSAVASAVLISRRSASRDEVIGAWESVAKEVGGLLINEIGLIRQAEQESERGTISEGLRRTLDMAKGTIETVTDLCLNVPDVPADADEDLEGTINDCAVAIEKLAEQYEAVRKETRGDRIGPLARDLQAQLDLVQTKAEAVRIMSNAVNEKLAAAYKNKDDRNAEDDDEDADEGEEDPGGWDKAEVLQKLKAAKAGMFPADDVLAQVEAQALAGKLDEETADFARALRDDMVAGGIDGDDPALAARLDLQKIEPLIDKLKVDKAYFKIGNTVADLGVKAGAKWLESLGPAATLKDMLVNIYGAYQRAGELAKWQEGAQDSRNAGAYALVAAQLNRVGIEAAALTQDKIKVTLKTMQLIGDTLKLAGISGLYGAAVSATAQGVEIGRGVLTQYFSASQMETAWDAYQLALQNPGDRKLQREALRSNATLAKYALAWAAVDGGNPLAREAMRKCGLNDKVLASKDTDAPKVVKYLETLFDEDPIVLQASPAGEDWWPGTPELTARNWNRFATAAANADPKLNANSSVLVTKALAQVDRLLPAALADRKNEAAVAPARSAVAAARAALRDYRPTDMDGAAHPGMQTYASAMAALAELTARSLPDPPGTTP